MNCPETNSQQIPASSKSDIVFLVDLVTEHSSKVQHLSLLKSSGAEFLERAPNQKNAGPKRKRKTEIDTIPYKEKELRNSADDSPEGKERRRLISRRRMLHSLFNGELSVRDLENKEKANPKNLEKPLRNISTRSTLKLWKGPNNIEEF